VADIGLYLPVGLSWLAVGGADGEPRGESDEKPGELVRVLIRSEVSVGHCSSEPGREAFLDQPPVLGKEGECARLVGDHGLDRQASCRSARRCHRLRVPDQETFCDLAKGRSSRLRRPEVNENDP
jgi:hypothetical protein